MDDADARSLHAEQLLDLRGGELGDRDDAVRISRGATGLFSKAPPEFRCRIISGEHEQIVERGDGAPQSSGGEPLVEPMKDAGAAGQNRLLQQESAAVAGQLFAKRAQKPVRAVAELETGFGMRASETEKNLARVHADTRKLISNAVSCVEGDRATYCTGFKPGACSAASSTIPARRPTACGPHTTGHN